MTTHQTQLSLPLYEEISEINEDIFNEQLNWQTPEYITNNMVHTYRYYQDLALRFFHYSQTAKAFSYRNINHVLFNMATGSGKTDLMAGLILYLYQEHGYQNFIFLVNTNSVLNKTIDNLTNKDSKKYLYQKNLEIDGERVEIKQVKVFPKIQSKNTIYLKLSTVQSIASDIYTQKENTMSIDDFSRNKTIILGDEAHHFSSSTKSEKEKEQSWEDAISTILNANNKNLLLEFTATIPLENKKVYDKYKNKIIYKYSLDRFIHDGYSKNVKRIQSGNKDADNMMNAILLSEYRRKYALEKYGVYFKPVILFKSQRIEASKKANETFNYLIENLNVSVLENFLDKQIAIANGDNSETLSLAYNYYKEHNNLSTVVNDIKREMSPNRIINANDTDRSRLLEKGHYKSLNSLESPTNLYRVIFAVAKLTEGWDVLNLFDIVRLSDDPKVKGTRTSTTSEAQLIGRGARYNPFKINNECSFLRRFDNDSKDGLIMETIHYHTINEPQYLKNLVDALDEMNLPTGEDKKNPLLDIKIKSSFKKTNAWKNGKIFYNETVKVSDNYYSSLDMYGINTTKNETISYIDELKEVSYTDTDIYI